VGDILYIQTLSIISGKNNNANNTITEKDFELYPAETLQLSDLNENIFTRFSVPPNITNMPFCVGTINQIKVIALKPSSNLDVTLINANGTSQNITFLAGRTSVIHGLLTGILATNSTSTAIKGTLYIAGD